MELPQPLTVEDLRGYKMPCPPFFVEAAIKSPGLKPEGSGTWLVIRANHANREIDVIARSGDDVGQSGPAVKHGTKAEAEGALRNLSKLGSANEEYLVVSFEDLVSTLNPFE